MWQIKLERLNRMRKKELGTDSLETPMFRGWIEK